ncbi:MAG: winged helix DNA-binding protein [Saprospiraceae bacterium]|nr:winged helix DNA-binding protein [Saprospiraceae bacterium]
MNWIGDMPHVARLARVPYMEMMRIVYQRLQEMGFADANPSYSIVYQLIGEGARLTDMAKRANLSKQNMKYNVEQLEKLGYVSRFTDASDGRAVLFKLTKKGISFRDTAYKVIAEVELEWAKGLGKQKMIELKKMLMELNEVITNK